MVVGGEERTKHTVDESRCENLIVAGLSFALGESAREPSGSGVLFSVIHLQRHEICSGDCIFRGTNSGQKHGVAHTEHNGAVGLLCHFAGFNADGSSIRQ